MKPASMLSFLPLLLGLACSGGDTPAPRTIEPSQVKDIDVEEVLALLRDPADRPLVVNFWGTWCLPCVEELPDLAQASVDFQGVRFVGIGVERLTDREKARAASAKIAGHAGVPYELRLSTAPIEVLFRALGRSATFPTTLVLPGGGGEPTVYVGALQGGRLAEFRELLSSLEGKKGP